MFIINRLVLMSYKIIAKCYFMKLFEKHFLLNVCIIELKSLKINIQQHTCINMEKYVDKTFCNIEFRFLYHKIYEFVSINNL